MNDLEARLAELERRVQASEDKLAIHDLIVRYGLAVDLGDAEGVTNVFTPDADLMFSATELYDRSEGSNYLIVAMALMLQAVYLRHFYFRVAMVLGARMSRLFRGSPTPVRKAE